MKVYGISKARLGALRPSLMTRVAIVLTITIAAAGFISFRELGNNTDIRLLLLLGLWLGGVFTFALFKASRKARAQLDEMAETYELVLDSTGLTRRRGNWEDLTIDYSAIKAIEEHGNQGLRIKGNSAQQCIGVPAAVENYEQLKADLVSLTGLDIQRKSGSPMWTYTAVLLVVGLFAIGVLAPNRLLASGASFSCAAILTGGNILIWRNRTVPKDMKRRLLIGLVPAIGLLVRGIFLLRS